MLIHLIKFLMTITFICISFLFTYTLFIIIISIVSQTNYYTNPTDISIGFGSLLSIIVVIYYTIHYNISKSKE